MKRVNVFLTILIVSITALIAATIAGFTVFANQTSQNPHGWMSQMWESGSWGGMMGQNGVTTQPTTSSWLPAFGVIFAVLIGVSVVGIIGVAYYLLYPQMRLGATQPIGVINQPNISNDNSTLNAYESVAKTLTEEERKVVEVLNNHNGKYLQKYIKNETGLSRLKTHRIIARLAEREIVSLEKTGNTNQVYLANWLIKTT